MATTASTKTTDAGKCSESDLLSVPSIAKLVSIYLLKIFRLVMLVEIKF